MAQGLSTASWTSVHIARVQQQSSALCYDMGAEVVLAVLLSPCVVLLYVSDKSLPVRHQSSWVRANLVTAF